MQTPVILLAGGTGKLGGYLLKELVRSNFKTRALYRKGSILDIHDTASAEAVEADVTNPSTLKGLFRDVDVVISTVGITTQKEGLNYQDVDYQANINLLNQALEEGAGKFIYISSLHCDELRHLDLCRAKEEFVDELKISGIEYCVIRPNGFYSDLGKFLETANSGRVFLFGNGTFRLNPIHGHDMASEIVRMITSNDKELTIGGPETFSHNELVDLASTVLKKEVKTTYLPVWIPPIMISLLRFFTSQNIYGPLEFFITVMARDMIAPSYGSKRLKDFLAAYRIKKMIS